MHFRPNSWPPDRQDRHREAPALALFVLGNGRVDCPIKLEAAEQRFRVRRDLVDVVPDGVVRQSLRARDGELIAEKDVFYSSDEPLVYRSGPVEGDVP
jgi:hypothetical protein